MNSTDLGKHMSSQIETLLRATLARDADYQSHQMIKNGDLGAAAVVVLKARRRSLKRQRILFAFLILMPLVMNIALTIYFAVQQDLAFFSTSPGLGMFAILGLIQVPALIEKGASVARLEMLLTMWLIHDSETAGELHKPLIDMIAEVHP